MKIITQAKTLFYGSVAGLTLMVLAANPTLANSHNRILTPEQASSTSNEAKTKPTTGWTKNSAKKPDYSTNQSNGMRLL
jgi:hypothetical protein